MNDQFRMEMMRGKLILADAVGQMMRGGLSPEVICGALGSAAGNLIGMNVKPDAWESIIDQMKKPMLADAKAAYEMFIAANGGSVN